MGVIRSAELRMRERIASIATVGSAYAPRPSHSPAHGVLRGGPSTGLALLFLVAILLPSETSFYLGPVRFTVYRAILLLALVPLAFRVLQRQATLIDLLVALGGAWTMIALQMTEGSEVALQTGGSVIVESVGGYLMGRYLAGDAQGYARTMRLAIWLLMAVAVAGAVEAISHIPFVHQLASSLTGVRFENRIEPRFGLSRAYVSFDHPILLGTFAASFFSVAWHGFRPGLRASSRWAGSAACAIAAMSSLSSAAAASLATQGSLAAWDRLSRGVTRRWLLLAATVGLGYLAIAMVSTRSPFEVLLAYLTFDANTANSRMLIWEWGFWHNVVDHPLFGIGNSDWVRADWMVSSSVDNFWLVLMMTYGLPAFAFFAAAVLRSLIVVGRSRVTMDLAPVRFGWMSSMIGLVLAACTVHFWNQSFVLFFFLLGAGQWFGEADDSLRPRRGGRTPSAAREHSATVPGR